MKKDIFPSSIVVLRTDRSTLLFLLSSKLWRNVSLQERFKSIFKAPMRDTMGIRVFENRV